MTEIHVGVQAVMTARKKPWLILLGKRRGIFGDGQWGLPGGHLEFGESFEAAIRREIKEETGVNANMIQYLTAVNTPYTKNGMGTHYVQIGMQVLGYTGKPSNMEPDKCYEISWFNLHGPLPSPLFAPSVPFIELTQKRLQSPRLADASESRLSIHLSCVNIEKNMNKYVSYDLLADVPALIIRLGRRGEVSTRQVRVYTPSTSEQGFDLLRKDIARRLTHGYWLHDVRGTMSIDSLYSVFPPGAVVFRLLNSQVSSGGFDGHDNLRRENFRDLRAAVNPMREQPTLFDEITDGP